MFGLGVWELALIAVVALLVLGPEKLPDAAKSLGKALRDFRRAGDDLKREMIGDALEEVPPRPAPKPSSIPETVAHGAPAGSETAPPPAATPPLATTPPDGAPSVTATEPSADAPLTSPAPTPDKPA